MLPSIFISCVPIVGQGTIALGTSAFGKGVGTFTLGASTGCSSYHEALVSGHSNGKAIMYGLLSGSSEALLQRFLGGISGLSDVNVIGFKTYLQSMVKEGLEEATQQAFDSTILRTSILDDDVDFDQLVKNVGKSAAYGALTAGILNVGVVPVNRINSGNIELNTNTDTNIDINSSDSNINSSVGNSDRGVLLTQASDALVKRGEWLSERSKKSSEASKRGVDVATISGDRAVVLNSARDVLEKKQEFINKRYKKTNEIANNN